jgi:hypothetical protein
MGLLSKHYIEPRQGGFYCDLYGHRVYKDACEVCSLGPRGVCGRCHED